VIGDDLLLENPALREACRLFALTYIEVMRITFPTLKKLLQQHPREARQVRASTCWLILKRGIIMASEMERERQDSLALGGPSGQQGAPKLQRGETGIQKKAGGFLAFGGGGRHDSVSLESGGGPIAEESRTSLSTQLRMLQEMLMNGGDGAAGATAGGGSTPGGPRKSMVAKNQLAAGASGGDNETHRKTMVVGDTGGVLTGRKKSEFYQTVSTEQLMADEGSEDEDSEESNEDEQDEEGGQDDRRGSSRGSVRKSRSSRTSIGEDAEVNQPTLTITTTIASGDQTTSISRVVPADSLEGSQLTTGTLSTTVRRQSADVSASRSSRLSLSSAYEELDGSSWTERRQSRRRSQRESVMTDDSGTGSAPVSTAPRPSARPKAKVGFN
jgi:hypothetical protein